jgi:glycosyltransferase involved in cell wall biosynthesis
MPKIDLSFIIPALNEQEHIGAVLDSIRRSVKDLYAHEVIVVDNGSADRTLEIAQSNGATCFQIRRCTISKLRNVGVAKSVGDILVFLDADVYLAENWAAHLEPMLKLIAENPLTIGGSIYGISRENSWIERFWFAPRSSMKRVNYMNGGHMIMHRSLFERSGGFREDLETGEDYEFCQRGKKIGATVVNDPELKVIHAGYPKTVRAFFKRERWHSRGDYKSIQTLLSSKPAILSLFNLIILVVLLAAVLIFGRPWPTASFTYMASLCFLSAAAAIARCKSFSIYPIICTFLYMVYFTARTLSLMDILSERAIRRMKSRRKEAAF